MTWFTQKRMKQCRYALYSTLILNYIAVLAFFLYIFGCIIDSNISIQLNKTFIFMLLVIILNFIRRESVIIIIQEYSNDLVITPIELRMIDEVTKPVKSELYLTILTTIIFIIYDIVWWITDITIWSALWYKFLLFASVISSTIIFCRYVGYREDIMKKVSEVENKNEI